MKKLLLILLLLTTAATLSPLCAAMAAPEAVVETVNSAAKAQPDWPLLALIAGGLSLLGGIGTIILALACFGGCAPVTLLLPTVLFLIGGWLGFGAGIAGLRKRKELAFKRKNWMSWVGAVAGAAAGIFGLYAFINLLRD